MEKEVQNQREYRAKGKYILAMFIFGTIGILVKGIALPSSIIALFRGLIGTLFLLLVTAVRKTKLSKTDIKNNLWKLLISGALIGVNWILLFESYHYTTVSIATLCYYMAPIFIIIASPFVLKEKLTLKKFLCVICAILGMVLVSGIFTNTVASPSQGKGILLGLLAAFTYACVVLLNKCFTKISAYDMTIVQLSAATLVLLPYTLLTEDFSKIVLTPVMLCLLLFVGLVNTGAAYAMYFSSMQKLKAQTVAIFSYIDPIVAILLSAVLLKEKMDVYSIIGAVMILLSTLLNELFDKK